MTAFHGSSPSSSSDWCYYWRGTCYFAKQEPKNKLEFPVPSDSVMPLSVEQEGRLATVLGIKFDLLKENEMLGNQKITIENFCKIFSQIIAGEELSLASSEPQLIGSIVSFIFKDDQQFNDVDINYYLEKEEDLQKIPHFINQTILHFIGKKISKSKFEDLKLKIGQVCNYRFFEYPSFDDPNPRESERWALISFGDFDLRFIVSNPRPYVCDADSLLIFPEQKRLACLRGGSYGVTWGSSEDLRISLQKLEDKIFDVEEPEKIHAFSMVFLGKLLKGYRVSKESALCVKKSLKENFNNYHFFTRLAHKAKDFSQADKKVFCLLNLLELLKAANLNKEERKKNLENIRGTWPREAFITELLEQLCPHPELLEFYTDYFFAQFFFNCLQGDQRFAFHLPKQGSAHFLLSYNLGKEEIFLQIDKSFSKLVLDALKALHFFENAAARQGGAEDLPENRLTSKFFASFLIRQQDLKSACQLLLCSKDQILLGAKQNTFFQKSEKKALYTGLVEHFAEYIPWEALFSSEDSKKRQTALQLYPKAAQALQEKALFWSYVQGLIQEGLLEKKRKELLGLPVQEQSFKQFQKVLQDSKEDAKNLCEDLFAFSLQTFPENFQEVFAFFAERVNPISHRILLFDWIIKNAKLEPEKAAALWRWQQSLRKTCKNTQATAKKKLLAFATLSTLDVSFDLMPIWNAFMNQQRLRKKDRCQILKKFKALKLDPKIFWMACSKGVFFPQEIKEPLQDLIAKADYAFLEEASKLLSKKSFALFERFFYLLEQETSLEDERVITIYEKLRPKLTKEEKEQLHALFVQKLKAPLYAKYCKKDLGGPEGFSIQEHRQALALRRCSEEVDDFLELSSQIVSKDVFVQLLQETWLEDAKLWRFYHSFFLESASDAELKEPAFEAALEISKRDAYKTRLEKKSVLCTYWKKSFAKNLLAPFLDFLIDFKDPQYVKEALNIALRDSECLEQEQVQLFFDQMILFLTEHFKVEKDPKLFSKVCDFFVKEQERISFDQDARFAKAILFLKHLGNSKVKQATGLQKRFLLSFASIAPKRPWLKELKKTWRKGPELFERLSWFIEKYPSDKFFEIVYPFWSHLFSLWKDSEQDYNRLLIKYLREIVPHCNQKQAFELYGLISEKIEGASRNETIALVKIIEDLEDRGLFRLEEEEVFLKKRALDKLTIERIMKIDPLLSTVGDCLFDRFKRYLALPWSESLNQLCQEFHDLVVEVQCMSLVALSYGEEQFVQRCLNEMLSFMENLKSTDRKRRFFFTHFMPYLGFSSLLPLFFPGVVGIFLKFIQESAQTKPTSNASEKEKLDATKKIVDSMGQQLAALFSKKGFGDYFYSSTGQLQKDLCDRYGRLLITFCQRFLRQPTLLDLVEEHETHRRKNVVTIKEIWSGETQELNRVSDLGLQSVDFSVLHVCMVRFFAQNGFTGFN